MLNGRRVTQKCNEAKWEKVLKTVRVLNLQVKSIVLAVQFLIGSILLSSSCAHCIKISIGIVVVVL